MFYIVKVIDRDNEQDGVKFWRFKHNYKQEGVLDKILPIWKAKGDVTDAEKGRDLIIELTKAKPHKEKNIRLFKQLCTTTHNHFTKIKELWKVGLKTNLRGMMYILKNL